MLFIHLMIYLLDETIKKCRVQYEIQTQDDYTKLSFSDNITLALQLTEFFKREYVNYSLETTSLKTDNTSETL